MNILITGDKGFVGKNLAEALKNIRDGKDRTRPDLKIEEIYLYDIDSTKEKLEKACERADLLENFKAQPEALLIPEIPNNSFAKKHNILNLSETENLVTLMWANESFDPNKPDTFFVEV